MQKQLSTGIFEILRESFNLNGVRQNTEQKSRNKNKSYELIWISLSEIII